MYKLAQLRKDKGISQRKLAAISGVGHITIARIEMGSIDPRVSTIKALAEALGVKIDAIVD